MSCLSGCASRRLLAVENELLRNEAGELHRQVAALEHLVPDPDDFVREPDLEAVHVFLDRAGYQHDWEPDAEHIRFEYVGHNTAFRVHLQVFSGTDVLFVSTSDYFSLAEASGTDSLVMLITELATQNYDLLLGKFQLNPQSGEIMLSVEITVRDGLGYRTLTSALEHLCRTADVRYPDLLLAARGRGI